MLDINFSDDCSAVVDIMAAASTSNQTAVQKLLYDRKSAAYALSISVRSLDYLISQKQLTTIKLGSKVMIGHGELVKFSRANHVLLTQNPTEAA